ncbi:hypothetical protein FA95DRAFT_1555851 [Auriscalpium vulgare]|uniref:Uncharacterized protein n=1 Tax=Auriscalpium vulgare TaxID=40419 RepID=A0ACB8S228_9AGAM|nr:hypothetical protein FA95DRAFT_1555851 [Auriscalpium vulgare]
MSSSTRKLSPLEARLHQAALHAGKPLTQKEVDTLAPDAAARTGAINFLLGAELLKVMKDPKGGLSYRVVTKNELDIKKGMSGEESMVLGHIQAAGNNGIWTKHLKAKTELHQTVIDRCLKSLTQKQLVKAVKGVKYPTRKIYMMAHLEPSVELTGGPWYTDNELDTEFIKLLCSACLRYIKDKTFPKHKVDDDSPASSQPLYPISGAPSYPTSQQVLTFLSKSKITETQFNEDHVDMLLNVLVLDGEIEKLPAFGAALWDANVDDDAADAGSESEDDGRARRKKRKHKRDSSVSSKTKKRKKELDSDANMSSSGSGSDSEDDRPKHRSRKSKSTKEKGKGKKRKRDSGTEDEGGSDRETKKRKKTRKVDRSDEESDDEDNKKSKHKPKSKSRSKSKSSKRSRGSSPDTQSDSDSSSSTASDSKHSSSKSRSKSKSKVRARSSSPAPNVLDDVFSGGAYVYRAVRQERVALGWSQAPCGRCPVFDFCKDGGPVGPRGCEYYGEWLGKAVVEL